MLVHKLINSLYAHCYCQCILFLSKNFVAVPNSLTHHVFLFHMKKHTIRMDFKYCLVIWWSFWIFTAFDWSYWTTPTKLSGTLYLRNIITILFMRRKIVLQSLWAVIRGNIVVRQKQKMEKAIFSEMESTQFYTIFVTEPLKPWVFVKRFREINRFRGSKE